MPKPTPSTPPLTAELIVAQEQLYPRVAALLKQVERAKGNDAAPPESLRLGRELTREVAKLLGKAGRGIGVARHGGRDNAGRDNASSIDNAALAMGLGQALAGLEAFEAAHAQLSAAHQAICWVLPGGTRVPVARLLPRTPPKGAKAWGEAEARVAKAGLQKVRRRLIQRENFIYLVGYRDGVAGKPPRQPLDEFQTV